MTVRRLKEVLIAIVVAGAVALFIRFTKGLGAVTNLSDTMPWGLWKVVNMVAGVALSTGGFAFAAAVHVFRIHRLEPLLRPALFVAALGYASSCAALFIDIGLPYRIWHPLVNWNVHSFLFEVAWCVMLYSSITLLEVTPIALEGSKHKKILTILRLVSPPIVIIGITLSTLHHTTLGSLFLVSPSRLHPLWYAPGLPLLFFLSALGSGIMSIILVVLGLARLYKRAVPVEAVRFAGKIAATVLSLYFVVKVTDLVRRESLGLLVNGQWESFVYLGEVLLGVVAPIALVLVSRKRQSLRWLGAAAALTVFGVVLNRVNVGIVGFVRSSGHSYFPSLAEIAISVSIPALAALVFLLFAERCRVYSEGHEPVRLVPTEATAERRRLLRWPLPAGSFASLSFLFVAALSLALGLFPASAKEKAPLLNVRAPVRADAEGKTLVIDGDRDGDAVVYPHEVHAELFGEQKCDACHHLTVNPEKPSTCTPCHGVMQERRPVFSHDRHIDWVTAEVEPAGGPAENQTCSLCHEPGDPSSELAAGLCDRCHDGTGWQRAWEQREMRSYVDALHSSCMRCHGEKAEGPKKRKLQDCRICHR